MSTTTTRYTVDEYFEREFASEFKHEYIDGEIIQMVGGSTCHNKILENLYRLLFVTFSPQSYRVCVDNVRLKIPDPISYVFPDAMLVREPAEYEENRLDTLLNPTTVFEVLSPSTEYYVRHEKYEKFQRVTSLRDYVLISQEKVLVERYSRQPDQSWQVESFEGSAAKVTFQELNWSLELADLYHLVPLPE